MKTLWLTTTHAGLESIIKSLVLYLNVSSMNQEGTVTSLERYCSGKYEFIAYRYDEGKEAQFHYDGEVDHNILRKLREINPEIVIYSGPAAGRCKPKLETLQTLRGKAKAIGYVLDGGCPEWHPLLQEYKDTNAFDLLVNTDGNPNWPKRPDDLTLWQPVDEQFYETKLPKDIRFGFAGGNGSPHRRDAIAALSRECNLQVAERREDWGSYKHFADFMLRCQITVNFPETGSGKSFHLKNRVLEAGWAGCCLFERKNPITPLYFTPGFDYIQYETIDELIRMVKDISDREIALRAWALKEKCQDRYTSQQLWKRIFAHIL